MKTTLHITVSLALVCLLTSACTTSKSLYKDALQYEQSGMYDKAIAHLKWSLNKKNNNEDARAKLQELAPKALNMKLDEFSRHNMLKDHDRAVHAYNMAEKFKTEINYYGLGLGIPTHYTERFKESRNIFLEDLYTAGVEAFEAENYNTAAVHFEQLLDEQNPYKDVRELLEGARCEPIYQQAMSLFDLGQYRRAYDTFERCARKGDYKDVHEYMILCIELDRVTLAIAPLENNCGNISATEKLHAYALQSLVNINDPFLRVVERDNLQQIIDEQNFGLSGSVDESTAVEAGQLSGATMLVSGEVVDHQVTVGRMQKIRRKGFLPYEVTVTTPQGLTVKETRYKAVDYFEFKDRNSVAVSFSYRLLDVKTAEILQADVIHRERMDQVHYATFSGDNSKLLPAKGDGTVDRSYSAKSRLRGLLSARRTLKSTAELGDAVYQEAAREMSRDVASELDI